MLNYGEKAPADSEGVACFDYRHIMLAVDNSAYSNRGIEIGLALAKGFDATITASHAYAAKLHDLRFKQMEGGLPAQYHRERELEKQRETHDTLITNGLEIITDSYLDVVEEKAQEQGLQIQRKSVEGKNYRALIDDIEASDYDLVVMGAFGLGSVRSSIIGSVCERVVRRCSRDVLVVKNPEQAIGDGPIMVAVDGSEQGFAALKTALLLGRTQHIDVEVVSAFDPYFHYIAFNSIAGVLSDEAGKVFKFKEQEQLHEEIIDSGLAKIYKAHLAVSEKIAAEDGVTVQTNLLSGKPYEVILQHIEKSKPSLLVLGKTGVHADPQMDIGSNAENLLRLASCHILLCTRKFSPRAEQIAEETMAWTDEGAARMQTVPAHVRKMARMAIIRYAQDKGHTVISTRIVDEAIGELLPADAMEAMGLLTAAAKKRKQQQAEQAATALLVSQEGAARTFDARTVLWDDAASGLLATIEDNTARTHTRLRAEKLALSEKNTTITRAIVLQIMGDEAQKKEAAADDEPLIWTHEAIARIERVPAGFMRDASRTRVEAYARRQGGNEITLAVCEAGMVEARQAMVEAMQSQSGRFGSNRSGTGLCSGQRAAMQAARETADKPANLVWTAEAKVRLEDVPEGFMRTLTKQRIESFAARKQTRRIDNDLIDAKYAEWGHGSTAQTMTMPWEEGARQRLARIPDFVRGMVAKEVERCARETGQQQVGLETLSRASQRWEQGGSFHSEHHPGQYSDHQEDTAGSDNEY